MSINVVLRRRIGAGVEYAVFAEVELPERKLGSRRSGQEKFLANKISPERWRDSDAFGLDEAARTFYLAAMTPRGIPVALALLWAARSLLGGTDEVCHVGSQLHLASTGNPEESYMRHVRAFVEGGLADYVQLVVPGLKDNEREQVVRYLAEYRVHFLLRSEGFPTGPQWFQTTGLAKVGEAPHARCSAADYERIRAIAGDLFRPF